MVKKYKNIEKNIFLYFIPGIGDLQFYRNSKKNVDALINCYILEFYVHSG